MLILSICVNCNNTAMNNFEHEFRIKFYPILPSPPKKKKKKKNYDNDKRKIILKIISSGMYVFGIY